MWFEQAILFVAQAGSGDEAKVERRFSGGGDYLRACGVLFVLGVHVVGYVRGSRRRSKTARWR